MMTKWGLSGFTALDCVKELEWLLGALILIVLT